MHTGKCAAETFILDQEELKNQCHINFYLNYHYLTD